MAAKKTRKTQVPTARLVIIICAIVLGLGACWLIKTSWTILATQWKMYSYYCDINKANGQHDYFYDMARSYPLGGYMHSAEEWDEKAEALTKERADFVANATDPVVKWACRDQCELLTVLAGFSELLIGFFLLGVASGVLVWISFIVPAAEKHQRAAHRARRNQTAAPYRTR